MHTLVMPTSRSRSPSPPDVPMRSVRNWKHISMFPSRTWGMNTSTAMMMDPATASARRLTASRRSRAMAKRYPTKMNTKKAGKNLTRTAMANVIPAMNIRSLFTQYMVSTANIAETVSGMAITPEDISSTGDRKVSAKASSDFDSSPVSSLTSFMTAYAVMKSHRNRGTFTEYMMIREGTVAVK